jgi:hypothetical protein
LIPRTGSKIYWDKEDNTGRESKREEDRDQKVCGCRPQWKIVSFEEEDGSADYQQRYDKEDF